MPVSPGHTHALCGVSVVPGTPQILSADAGSPRCGACCAYQNQKPYYEYVHINLHASSRHSYAYMHINACMHACMHDIHANIHGRTWLLGRRPQVVVAELGKL